MTGRFNQRIRIKPAQSRPYLPTVTVVVSCFNYAHFLPEAVHSCLDQNDVDVDIIIVDDASSDNSLAVARDLAESHANISVLAHTENKGMVPTFNDGAMAATGEFLVRLDADDLLTPGSLARATLVAQHYPSVGLVYGHPIHFAGRTLPKPRTKATGWTIWPGTDWLEDRCRSGKNVITSPEVLMRRSLVQELGYQAPLHHTPDMELWLRLSAFADIAYIQGADQAWHREHEQSMSAKEVDGVLDLHERLEAFETLFSGIAGQIPDAGRLMRRARQTLAKEAVRTARLEIDRGLPHVELLDAYVRFALAADPSVVQSPHLQLISAAAEVPGTAGVRLLRLARRASWRMKCELSWHRWHRQGVF